MLLNSPEDFFTTYITVTSALMPEDFKLTDKQIKFLVECCMYHYEGNDLGNMKELKKHFLSKRFFTRGGDVSIYKYNIGVQKWAETGRNKFILPGILNSRKGDALSHELKFEYVDASVSDR